MYVSAQALTKQIGLLEEELGGKLFERSPQGVSLTRLGIYARERFEKIDRDLNDTIEELKIRAGDKKERINIGIFSALPQEQLVSPVVSFLLGAFPDYQIGLNMIDLDEGRKLLLDNKIDFLMTNTHEEDNWEGYRCLSFGEFEAKIIVSLLHPWAVKSQITVEDMEKETFLKMDVGQGHYIIPQTESFYENIPCKNVQRVSNFDTMITLLNQGSAFAVFPMVFANMDHAKVKSFDLPGRKLLFHTAIIYNPYSTLNGINKIGEELAQEFDLKEIIV
jgi:DNA-binding transcriptional LysR family regulator